MKLEEILKKRGYTDSDIEAIKPMLADQRFRASIEEEFGTLETEKTKLDGELNRWSEWHKQEALPAIDKALKAEQDAAARAAAAEARLKAAQEQGLIKLEEQQNNPPPKKDDEVFDPKKHNLVTMDDVQKFGDAYGDSIAIAQDIAAEHFALFGKPLTNFRELRTKALAAKKPVYDYWQENFKVADKRAEIEAKQKADAEAAIRADERNKVIAEQANPNTRAGMPSRFSFLPPKDAKAGEQPWENANQRTQERVRKATEKVLQQVQ